MIILASKSPRRKQLLCEAGIKFECFPANIQESSAQKDPALRVKDLALQKALSVAQQFTDMPVLGSDTLVHCKGEILGKPHDIGDALRMLHRQNGSWQEVCTGVALVWKNRGLVFAEAAVSRCLARTLPEEILSEIAAKHLDKAGAYAVQDKDDHFIEKIEGSLDTVVGLPVFIVKKLLAKAGINPDGSFL